MSKKLITIKDLAVGYNGIPVISDINLDIYDHDFIGVIGPNGGGKTTFVKSILGLLPTLKGSIEYFFPNGDKNIGYLPQQVNFDSKFPIRIIDVVLSGLMNSDKKNSRFSKSERQTAYDLLETMGVSKYSNSLVSEISGGQLQRVLICRALISKPSLLLLDEPTTYVDSSFEKELNEILHNLNKEIAIIMVSHDIGMISYYVKTIACINRALHYHQSNIISEEQLRAYNCPIQLITHGDIPHTVLHKH